MLELDNQKGQWDEISDDYVDVDFSSLTSCGIETEYTFGRGWVHWGINPGGSIAWKNDDTNISGGLSNENGGTLRVDLDNSMLLAELHLGGYLRGRLSDRITTYAAAGPMLMYGYHEVEDENVEETPGGAPGRERWQSAIPIAMTSISATTRAPASISRPGITSIWGLACATCLPSWISTKPSARSISKGLSTC